MIIRPATAADVERLASVAVASYRAAFLPILGETGLALRQRAFFLQRFAEQWPTIHVAENDGKISGFHQVREGTLDMLFLNPERRGLGIGRILLAHAETLGAIRLECFRDNGAARRFYERAGWRVDREYTREFAGVEHAFVAYAKP